MSYDLLRQACVKAFTDLAEFHTTAAINISPAAIDNCDKYTMVQVDRLARASAFMEAAQRVTQEFKRISQPELVRVNAAENVTPLPKRSIY